MNKMPRIVKMRNCGFSLLFVLILGMGMLSGLHVKFVIPVQSQTGGLDTASYASSAFMVDADIYVPVNYSTIQEAINAAIPGDTIFVDAGVFNENVKVNKTVELIGTGQSLAIVNASNPNDDVFSITSNYVNISGFTVSGASGVDKAGLKLQSVNHDNVSGNYIINNYYGILLATSNNSTATENTLTNNSYGFYLNSSSGNSIYHNNVVNNTQQAFDNGTNTWDDGYPSGGNYWSDQISPDNYTGTHQNIAGFDFFVDSPYNILGAADQDHFPFVILDGWQKPLFTSDVILVAFKPGVPQEIINETIARYGAETIEHFDLVDFYFLRINVSDCSEWEMARRFAGDQNVSCVTLDYYTYLDSNLVTPDDPCFNQQWALDNFGINPGAAKGVIDADIDAPQAWEHKTNSSDVVVALIDTGVDLNQPDLAGNLWKNPIEVQNGIDDDGNGVVDDIHGAAFAYDSGPPGARAQRIDSSGSPDDIQGHGTHCAGIIGAVGNNGEGVTGVNWAASIMAIKYTVVRPVVGPILEQVLPSVEGTISTFVAAVNYILEAHAHSKANVKVVSYSSTISRNHIAIPLIRSGMNELEAYEFAERLLSEGSPCNTVREVYASSIQKLQDEGIYFVCAAGNDGVDIDTSDSVSPNGFSVYPCKLAAQMWNVISVAASDNKDRLDKDSNSGTKSVTLAAPGVNILSLAMHGQIIYRDVAPLARVSPGDQRLAGVTTTFPPRSQVADGDCDVGQSFTRWQNGVRHDESVAVNGQYDPEEHVYADLDSSGDVSVDDMRLSDVYIAGVLKYRSRTIVADTDADARAQAKLIDFTNDEMHTSMGGIYRAANRNTVSVGDTRLTSVEVILENGQPRPVSYRAGSTVMAGDSDCGCDIWKFSQTEKHDEVVLRNGAYDPGEHVYEDRDSSGTVTEGDRRLTPCPPYLAGTIVGRRDRDAVANRHLVPFKDDERYSLVTRMSGTSMATPFVSGALAHFLSLFPKLPFNESARWYLDEWTDPRPGVANSVEFGKNNDGRLRMISGDDFGDAPDPFTNVNCYPTKTRYRGASHEDIGEEWLGYYGNVTPEFDADVLSNYNSYYDGDIWPGNILPSRIPTTPKPNYIFQCDKPDLERYDDGVWISQSPPPGEIILAYSICTAHEDVVDAEGGRYLPGTSTTLAPDKRLYINIWIDWNQDGDWEDPGEHVYWHPHNPTLEWNTTHCSKWIYITILVPPYAAPNMTWLRARLDYGENTLPAKYDSNSSLQGTRGLAQFGEVEDYQVNVTLACPPESTEWPMEGCDPTRTRYSVSPGPCSNNTIWTCSTGGIIYSSPAVAGGKVYIGSLDGKVYAVDAETGAPLWNFTTGNWIGSSPAVDGGRVFVSSCDGKLYALNANSGSLLWNCTTGGGISSPAVVDGVVFVGALDHNLYAVDAANGTILWNYTAASIIESSPAVADGKIFFMCSNGRLYALDIATRNLNWSYNTNYNTISSPAVANGRIYITSTNGNIYCLDSQSGYLLWNFTAGDRIQGSAAVAKGKVYVGSYDRNVYALNASDGSVIWKTTLDGVVYIPPAIACGQKVYTGTLSGRVYSIDAEAGTILWTYNTGSGLNSPPAVANRTLFIGSSNGMLYAFRSLHDISITTAVSSKTAAEEGFTVIINATVKNKGDFPETFGVVAFANSTFIQNTSASLGEGNSITVTFVWNTTGMPKGNYTIRVYASPIPSETDTIDNTFLFQVAVTVPGDVDGNFRVNMGDVVAVVDAFGSHPAHPGWNPNADIFPSPFGDGKIDMGDIVTALDHFGQHYP